MSKLSSSREYFVETLKNIIIYDMFGWWYENNCCVWSMKNKITRTQFSADKILNDLFFYRTIYSSLVVMHVVCMYVYFSYNSTTVKLD